MISRDTNNGPLSPATLHILLALAGGNLHGYGIIKEIRRSSEDQYRLGPGTLYDNLKKLMEAGLVADAPQVSQAKRRSAATKEDDRRFYMLTKEGKDVLAKEVDRLQSVVSQARLRLRESRARI